MERSLEWSLELYVYYVHIILWEIHYEKVKKRISSDVSTVRKTEERETDRNNTNHIQNNFCSV